MKLLTFLGTFNYNETEYTLHDNRHLTRYCSVAIAKFYKPDDILVVVTELAKVKHLQPFTEEIMKLGLPQPIAIDIKDGRDEAEIWDIFHTLTKEVAEGDELIVDITNGFRSLPFLSFLAIAFLRMARKVKVRYVHYGVFEPTSPKTTAILDLTPFVTLLDWTIATDRFNRFGDATDLATLLQQEIPLNPKQKGDKLFSEMKNAAENMTKVSLALRVSRVLEVMEAGNMLVQKLKMVGETMKQNSPPFALLAEQIQLSYSPFALTKPLEKANWHQNLAIQLQLIKWYLDKGQIVQGVILAREWVVSLLAYKFESDSLNKHEDREKIEEALNKLAKNRPPITMHDKKLRKLPNYKIIKDVWGKLTDLRNKIAHVTMDPMAEDSKTLRDEFGKLYPYLNEIGNTILQK